MAAMRTCVAAAPRRVSLLAAMLAAAVLFVLLQRTLILHKTRTLASQHECQAFPLPALVMTTNISSSISLENTSYLHESIHTDFHYRNQIPSFTLNQACTFKRSIFYLKIYKTASSTINTLLDRVVMKHGLKLVPVTNNPYPSNRLQDFVMYRPHSGRELGTFNVFTDHYIYDHAEVKKVMSPDTVFVASVRYPLSHLRSVFEEFFLAKKFGIRTLDPVATFLDDLHHYKDRSPYTRSLQAIMFGLPHNQLDDNAAIEKLIHDISNEFPLVLITEYLSESLVLLRRLMCWEMDDVMYVSQRVDKHVTHKHNLLPWSLEQKHRKYSSADYRIYNHFVNKLFRQISTQEYFWKEVDTFKRMNRKLAEFCEPVYDRLRKNIKSIYAINKENTSLVLDPHPWGSKFVIFEVECAIMKLDTVILRNIIKVNQYPQLCHAQGMKRTMKRDLYFNLMWNVKTQSAIVNQKYCSDRHPRFKVPLAILADKSAYMWLTNQVRH